jgi:hypothetical protein
MKFPKFLAAFATAAALFAGSAHAAPVLWTLTGVTFDDGATASGSFTYDASTNTYSGWSVSITAGTFPAITYDTVTSELNAANEDADGVIFVIHDFLHYVNLNFDTALTDAGGTSALSLGTSFGGFDTTSYECNNCSTYRWVTAGAVTTGTVPEPATLLLVGTLLAGGALTRRRRS